MSQADRHASECAECVRISGEAIQSTVVPASEVKKVVNRSTYKCPIC